MLLPAATFALFPLYISKYYTVQTVIKYLRGKVYSFAIRASYPIIRDGYTLHEKSCPCETAFCI